MLDLARKFIFLIVGFFVFSGFLLLANSADAVNSVLRGQAYWGNKGYIYFNCMDDVIGNRFDETNNLAGGSRYLVPPAALGFHFYAEPCVEFTHGVEMDDNNFFLGKGWNPSLGNINFEYDGSNLPPDYNFAAAHCPACTSGNNCIACYDDAVQSVYGWARIELTGDWIKLDSTSTVPVRLQSNDLDPVLPGYSVSSGDFVGTASSALGDISFNCESEDYPGIGTCASRQYKVYVKNLRLGRLSAPNWSYSSACTGSALRAILRWGKLSGTQTAYEVIVNDSNIMSTTTGAYVCWSGKVNNPSATQYIVSDTNPDCGSRFNYNTAYYWWIRAYDEDGVPTEWYQYNSNTLADTDQNLDGQANTFQTFKHEFPSPFFSWEPLEVMTGTSTTFTSESFVYTNAQPDLAQSCDPSRCSYYWETTDPSATIYATTSAITDINFFTATNTTVTLTVTDNEGYVCSSSSPQFRVNYDLPIWHEIKAQ